MTASVGTLLAVLLAQVALAPTGSAATAKPPGGRTNWTMAMMDGKPEALSVRLATYQFASNGTVTEKYWAWSQNAITGKGNVSWTKPFSGYRTTGCRYACPVRTPVGFQKGSKPHAATGRWSMESSNVLAIRWSTTYPVERWQINTNEPGIAGGKLISARNGGYGWMIGSNASLSRGDSLARVYESGWINGPFAENAYSPTTKVSWIGWSARDYTVCPTGTCMQAKKMTSADRAQWYHSYFAGDPAVDGRKDYWNNQTGVVQQLENPNTTCISASGGGHTNALLQVIDDNGQFVGFVGVEASLNQRKYGQAVVAAYAMLNPSLLPAIGASSS
jgi:hypothetical protein